ncbi:MAG: HAD family hydrolase [Anaerolineae bacterium]|nr:HAD family hydrolase [Anaerolineae bacterium]
MSMRILIWDFDGTLGYRDGGWSATLAEILHDCAPELGVTTEHIRPWMQDGYFWHYPEMPHTHIETADQWWAAMQPVFVRALCGVGVETERAGELAARFRPRYVDLSKWHLYDDVLVTLSRLSARTRRVRRGFAHVLLSNHIPELPDILAHLGLIPYLVHIFNSAQSGYEKPHPHAFDLVRQAYPDAQIVCMIGDSLVADVQGAESVGIPGLLVRRFHGSAARFTPDLHAVPPLIDEILQEGVH